MQDVTPLFLEETKFELIAYGCSGYSRTLGGHEPGVNPDPASGFDPQNQVDLEDPATYRYGKYVMWHGAQFRGMLANQRLYWNKVLTNIGITPR